ncbi:MAG: hypothetical protein EPN25_15140 [Nitrospirae bacterium]|nr:MAG: hypothetical protein EPN25_15140 [Nitrospirota bacterium]
MNKKLIMTSAVACLVGLFMLDMGSSLGATLFGSGGTPLSERQKRRKEESVKSATPWPVYGDQPAVEQPPTTTTTTTTTTEPQAQPAVQPQPATTTTTTTTTTTEPQAQPFVAPHPQPEVQPQVVQPFPQAESQPVITPQPQPAAQPRSKSVAVRKTSGKAEEISFNFDDADVFSVIQTIFGDILRVNYIVDPAVKGRVNFRSVAPVAKTMDDVMPLMEVILRLNGIGIVEEGGLYRIIPIGDLSKEPAAVSVGREADKVKVNGKALLQVVPVLYNQSTELTRVLTPFLSKNAQIVDVPKSNYIIIVDTDANVKRLLSLVEIFDSELLKQVTPKVFVYPVQNSKAKDVAALLQQIFLGAKVSPTAKSTPSTQRAPGTQVPGQPPQPPVQPVQSTVIPGAAGGETLVSENTKIIPDEVTNSIAILATPEDYLVIFETLQKIDIVPRQVMIEALIVQVKLKDNLSFGFSWSVNTDFNITGIKPFTNAVNLTGDVNINSPATAVANLPAKGFTFVGKDPTGTVRAVLTALAEESKAKVLASPHLLVKDNLEARMQVGSQVPLTTSQTSTTAATGTVPSITSTVQYKDIGIILKVKPQINDSGLISLELTQEISSIGEVAVDVGGLKNITIDKIEATSNLVAKDGETIIIGGLIREDISKAKDGIPFLNKIPIIGNLFGNTTDDNTRTELIILLTPHVMKNLKEAGEVTKEYLDRYKGYGKDKSIDEFIKDRSMKSGPLPETNKKDPQ